MQVWNHGSGIYSIYRCTGNKNNMLRIEILKTDCDMTETSVSILRSNFSISRDFSESDVLEQVELGLKDILQENNVNLYIKSIWFVDSDSNPVEIYRFLTYEILKAILNNTTVSVS